MSKDADSHVCSYLNTIGSPLPRTDFDTVGVPHGVANGVPDFPCVSRGHTQVLQGWARRSLLAGNGQFIGLRVLLLVEIPLHER